MTQAKLKKTETDEIKEKNGAMAAENNWKSKYVSDKYIQIAAWVLLTLGLCIIISTFYLAINQQVEDTNEKGLNAGENNGNEPDNNFDNGGGLSVDIIAKNMSRKIIEIGNKTIEGCEEKFCKMICMRAENFFETLNHSMGLSECNSFDALMIYEQHFDGGVLRNDWIDADRTVKELAIIKSQIATIKNEAFNAPMFSTVFMMYWRDLELEKVKSGALLGLHSLKYLMIDSKISCLDRAFFQPIQTTILYLKIRAGLTINRDESFFGISILEKLEYADLSRNNLVGPITKKTFEGAPNLKYLLLARCKITAVSEDAFEHLAGKLVLLDLSHNMLTTLSYRVLQPLVSGNARSLVNVAMNSFVCDCAIRPLVKVYKAFSSQFMDALYCKAPHELYGKFIDEVAFNSQNCESDSPSYENTTLLSSTDEKENVVSTSEPADSTTGFNDADTDESLTNVQMRCLHSSDSYENSEPLSWELLPGESDQITAFNLDEAQPTVRTEISARQYPIDSLRFAAPTHEFELHIFENQSARVQITGAFDDSVNVVWFAEHVQDFSSDVPCMTYVKPYIVTERLAENTTYTFCLIPATGNGITPFNCLPLYVAPVVEPEDIWIPQEHKPFTIGMLCLLFLMSTFAGAVIAYFGIRAYPDLLEGSKNVLIVKKSDKTCYVSTISEADYMKKASLKKKSSSSSIKKFSLPDTPTSLTSPSIISTAELDRVPSLKSSSTAFEDPFNPMPNLDDEYERPKPIEQEIIYGGRSIPNTYVATSPRRSPPPLPKRNSTANITDYAF